MTRQSGGHWLRTLLHPAILLLAFYNFAARAAEWGVNSWLLTVLKETGVSIGMVGGLSAVSFAVGSAAMLPLATNSDRWQERERHMIAATAG